jgi:hypothetical protein
VFEKFPKLFLRLAEFFLCALCSFGGLLLILLVAVGVCHLYIAPWLDNRAAKRSTKRPSCLRRNGFSASTATVGLRQSARERRNMIRVLTLLIDRVFMNVLPTADTTL